MAHEVVARIPALADYRAAQGDTRLLETLERAEFKITGDAPETHNTGHACKLKGSRQGLCACTSALYL